MPPTAASTCDNNVVGTLIKLIPLLYILETKPAKSPVIPPPIPIIKSDLLKFLDNNLFKKKFTELSVFAFSLEVKLRTVNLYFLNSFDIIFLYFEGTPLSKIKAIFFVRGQRIFTCFSVETKL